MMICAFRLPLALVNFQLVLLGSVVDSLEALTCVLNMKMVLNSMEGH